MTKKNNYLNIPKRHTARHYMNLVGKLYGETKENLDTYIEEQLKAHADNLDPLINCFESLLPKDHAANAVKEEKAKAWHTPKK